MAVVLIILLTEVMSNTAAMAAFLPLLGALAISGQLDPILLLIPATIAASYAFMMPIATPPNAIVFGSQKLPIAIMILNGFSLNVLGIAVIMTVGYGVIAMYF